MQLIWPWQDRQRKFSPLKASGFALTLAPAALLAYQLRSGGFGIYPLWLGGLTYWSGVWATWVLLAALGVLLLTDNLHVLSTWFSDLLGALGLGRLSTV